MDSNTLEPLLNALDDNIDDLEEALAPLLNAPISDTASKLPLLDKAKLYVMTTYAIESLLFSYLNLNGVKAKEHPIFTELTRLKQYYEKLKLAEHGPEKPNMRVDKAAAGRFIKAGLSGNDKYDQERAEREAKEKANAYIKFNQIAEQQEQDRLREERLAKKRKAVEAADAVDEEEDGSPSDDEYSPADTPASKTASSPAEITDSASASKQKKRKSGKGDSGKLHKAKKIKNQSPLENSKSIMEDPEETILPARSKSNVTPKSPGTAFKALLAGPLPRQEGSGTEQKNKRKKSKPKSNI